MFNSPRKSQEHKVYEALRGRKYFSSEEDAAFRRLRSGYEGEINFSYLIKKYLTQPYERIFDLNLKVNGSEGQFDCILISSKEVYHFEIKTLLAIIKQKEKGGTTVSLIKNYEIHCINCHVEILY